VLTFAWVIFMRIDDFRYHCQWKLGYSSSNKFFFFFLVVLGFELRTSHMLGRRSITPLDQDFIF
jgi:hypothetical protein